MNESCYNGVIGLARCACACNGGVSSRDNSSSSGLYITDLIAMDGIDTLDDCESPGNPWIVLKAARDSAIRTFVNDSSAMLLQYNKVTREPFKGEVGETSSREVITPSGTYAGLRIRCAPVMSGRFMLDKIGGVFNETGTITLTIFDNENNQHGNTYDLQAVAGKYKTVDVGLQLPMYSSRGIVEYYIVYEVGTNLPRATRTTCGCNGFDPRITEAFRSAERGPRAWANWIQIGGWSGESNIDFDIAAESLNSINRTYGLSISVRLDCQTNLVFCDGEFDANHPLSGSIASSIQLKAAEIVADKLLSSTDLNRYALINRDQLREERAKWRRMYAETVQYVSQTADVAQTGCLSCKHPLNLRTAPVFT